MYDAILAPVEVVDPEMENFLPMLNDYLKSTWPLVSSFTTLTATISPRHGRRITVTTTHPSQANTVPTDD